jgi:hypothetical protein
MTGTLYTLPLACAAASRLQPAHVFSKNFNQTIKTVPARIYGSPHSGPLSRLFD